MCISVPLCKVAYLQSSHLLPLLSAGVASVIFSNGRDLLIGDLHGRSFRTLVQSQNRGVAVGVDFHFYLHRIFWTDTVQDKVGRHFKKNILFCMWK